jgi:hypothetical protein
MRSTLRRPIFSNRGLWILVALLVFVVFVAAYGTNNPALFGHSSDEVEYVFTEYEMDCSTQPFSGFCQATCQVGGEVAISGSCVSSRGWGRLVMGTLDNTTYECSDASWLGSGTLIARVVCMR